MLIMTIYLNQSSATLVARISLMLAAVFFSNGSLGQSPLVAQLEVFQVQELNIDGEIFEQITDVKSASPGTLLEYVLTYRNVSTQQLAGFEVLSPIPANTTYIADSMQINVDHQLQVSLDGGETWLEEPILQSVIDSEGMEVLETVPVTAYSNLRWQIFSMLAPQEQVRITYRVQVL